MLIKESIKLKFVDSEVTKDCVNGSYTMTVIYHKCMHDMRENHEYRISSVIGWSFFLLPKHSHKARSVL